MRFARSIAGMLAALIIIPASSAIAAPMSEKAERLTTPSVVATWDISKLRELDDDSQIRGRHGLAVEQLKGMAIVNVAGDRIGVIDDVLANEEDQIVAVTVDVGGFLGVGGKEVIVGLDRLELRRDQFATAMSPDELKQQPEWDN